MERMTVPSRKNLDRHFQEIGFDFASIDGEPYWSEGACYAFTLAEIEEDLEAPTQELAALCQDLLGRIVRDEALLTRLGLPRHAWNIIAESWRRREPSLYGRFDFAYDAQGPAKLLEFNADTPTSLFESAVVQWFWLRDLMEEGRLPAQADQFNSLHERLIARWPFMGEGSVHLAVMKGHVEDVGTVAYLAHCAEQAGMATTIIDMTDIGLGHNGFVDRSGVAIERLFKLYPWEWLFADPYGASPALGATRFIEPPWKALLSSKALLPLLWQAAPGHPNLLEAYFEDDPQAARLGDSYARKPFFSREGANVTLYQNGVILAQEPGDYGREGFIRQALHPLPTFEGWRPVLGCWLVGDEPAGLGIREDRSPITSNRSRFTPHFIRD